MKTITLPALELIQDGTRLLMTKMKAGDLTDFTKIEPYRANKAWDAQDQGYQRPPEPSRIKKFANWLRKEKANGTNVRMPTAILLSGRGTDVVLSPSGTITLKSSNPLPLVDGQHRTKGFELAIIQKGLTEFADYEIPVVIMLDVNKTTEMVQFRIVNGEQKSVRTDLVNMILTQLAATEGDAALNESDHWKVIASLIVKKLNDSDHSPWKDKIVMPDQRAYSKEEIAAEPGRKHLRVARATSFMTANKPVINFFDTILPSASLNERAAAISDTLLAFWGALNKHVPDCFDDADNYVMQKTPGIFAITQFALNLMKTMYPAQVKFTKEEFSERIALCEDLIDPNYWNVGADGAPRGDAAKYGSMKGFKELGDLLWESYEFSTKL